MTVYATTDYDGERISENADILAFDTHEEARAYLLAGYDSRDWDLASAEIRHGRWSDCWIKAMSDPGDDPSYIGPFAQSDISVQHPGTHPGGRFWWITPDPDVLVLARINETASAE